MLMGFMLQFYIIFGTNLLTQGPVQIAVFFCLFQSFVEKEYQTESKQNKTFGRVIFGTNVIQGTWSGRQETMRRPRGRGRAYPPGRALHPRGPLVAPPTYFFLPYKSMYPGNIQEHHKDLIPLPQPSVPERSHLGAFSGILPEGELITEGFYINTIASPMKCE